MSGSTPVAATRREQIESRLPLVRSIARRYATAKGEPLEDLVQIGAIGLIKAVDRYDTGRGVALDVYAVPAIAGEIRHHLRDRCEPLRVPRRQRADGVRVQSVSLDGVAGPVADPMAGAPDRVALGTALRTLPPRERRIVLLSFVGDLSQAQVAARVRPLAGPRVPSAAHRHGRSARPDVGHLDQWLASVAGETSRP